MNIVAHSDHLPKLRESALESEIFVEEVPTLLGKVDVVHKVRHSADLVFGLVRCIARLAVARNSPLYGLAFKISS